VARQRCRFIVGRVLVVAVPLAAPVVLAVAAAMLSVTPLWGEVAPGTPEKSTRQVDASTAPSAADLGIQFVENSTTSVIVDRGGKRYLVDLATRSIRDAGAKEAATDPPAGNAAANLAANLAATQAGGQAEGSATFKQKCASCHGPDGKGIGSIKTPDFTNPAVQSSLTDQQIEQIIANGKPNTMMPAWSGKLSDAEISSVRGFIRTLNAANPVAAGQATEASKRKVYTPGDDLLYSLPTGRPVGRHSMTLNFTHRFPYTPSFTGPALGGSLAGLDDFSLSSLGLRYGVTDKLSVSVYRSPTFIGRPIQLMAAYNLLDERNGAPLNLAVRLSMQGLNNFSREYTENLEGVFSRSLGTRAQLYLVPTVSIDNRMLVQPGGFYTSNIPNVPGYNTFSLGAGGAFDIRPTVALVAEVIPTLVNGRDLDIHRPAFSFGIQKKIWRHSFTLGFTTSPGTTVAQRAGTRAAWLGQPSADTPGGLTIGFDLSRQLF
jgi:mono/diheme cytochrome c family protein